MTAGGGKGCCARRVWNLRVVNLRVHPTAVGSGSGGSGSGGALVTHLLGWRSDLIGRVFLEV